MKKLKEIVFVLLYSGLVAMTTMVGSANAGYAVIAHPDTADAADPKKEVRRIFMGKKLDTDEGFRIQTVNLPDDSLTTSAFYKSLFNKSVAQIKQRWAKLLFSGKAKEPKTFANDQEVLDWVSTHRNSYGYIDSASVNDLVKVIYKGE